jgi:excisionase family DNA binding protein
MPKDPRVLASIRNRHAAAKKPQPTTGFILSTPYLNMPPDLAQRPSVVAGLRRLLNTEEACAYLDCHERSIHRLIEKGRLKAYRLGRILKFRQEDLDAVLEPVHTGTVVEESLDGLIGQQTKSRAQ